MDPTSNIAAINWAVELYDLEMLLVWVESTISSWLLDLKGCIQKA